MSEFQIVIIPAQVSETKSDVEENKYGVRQHGRAAGNVIERIDDLGQVWDQVVSKLTSLAAQSYEKASESQYELSSIDFNVGIEAGLSVGLVTKGDASVSLTFTKKQQLVDA